MMETTETRRPRGRPQTRSDDESRQLVAAAARATFVAGGYSAANMDDVAKAAGVSKKTLYRLFPTKADLFRASISERIDSFILAVDERGMARLTPEQALVRVLAEYGGLTLSPDTVAIQKLVLAESDRFPQLAADFYRGAVIATRDVFLRVLRRLRDAGAIRLDDLEEAVGMLRGMMTFEPSRGAALGQAPLPGVRDIEVRAVRCAALFLDGCRHDRPERVLRPERCPGAAIGRRPTP